ncbi:pleckstrin homology domain-containing family A member 6 isoform X4 [Brienomyrus brachyistius]|uniref:pleckstrin homology domain-containing family A member 6 isoform X4 n=1 Tax=Brienomyrus brachyistius TaxID=42636 RepID=UPI0020B2A6EF|nr:pleckstrin homology domain-containing family A member 6 isoform X4 [Brienomyrus brachyistius]
MLKFRADRRVSQNDQNGTTGYPIIESPLEEIQSLQRFTQSSQMDMNGKAVGKGPASTTSDVNSNCLTMVTDLSLESQPNGRASRSSKKAVTFGKRSNSMRRNPKAEVSKQGWLYKQASNGVKQWNKRWFVLTDRCLFYYKDEKEEGVLGSLPLLSFQIGVVQPADNITRKHAFKVFCEVEEKEANSNGSSGFCLQAEHAGTRTYFFSADSTEEQEDWVHAMSEAACMHFVPALRNNSENIPPAGGNTMAVTKGAEPHQHGEGNTQRMESRKATRQDAKPEVNGVESKETTSPTTLGTPHLNSRDSGYQPNGWGKSESPHDPAFQPQESHDQRENTVLRRGFVPRTQSERMAQRKSSMTQLQQWVNQRRSMTAQEDIRSPSHFYTVNRGMAPEYYGVYSGSPYDEEYPLYPPGIRPESICSMIAGFDKLSPRWATEERRRSLMDGPLYGREPQWAAAPPVPPPGYYHGQLESAETSMRSLSMQPRSRSVPRSPSASSPGPYSPGPRNFPSPVRSPSAPFDRGPGRHREDPIYADPSIYGLRRSISSPKYEYTRDRRSTSQGMYHYKYPGSPSLHDKMKDILDLQLQRNLEYLDQQVMEGDHLIGLVTRMVEHSPRAKFYLQQVPPFHEVYRDIHPLYKANEIETGKLLGRLCDQHRLLKEQEAIVQRLRMEKESLEGALVATHQELELYRSQPSVASKLQLKKETLQNQLINIRGELSQASSTLTTIRMEFDALEDEVNAVHGDLWEQLNAGGQNELLHQHIQKEFWKIQDVLEGLHKNNPSRGMDTAKNRVVSGASGSFSTNSPASPLSSVSLTSPLSPFSPVSGSQSSPSKLAAMEHKFNYRSDLLLGEKVNSRDCQKLEQDRQANMNKVGIVPPRTKSPTEDELNSYDAIYRRNGNVPNGIARERPKSAVFPAEVRSKMSVEEQNERIRRNQSNSVRDKRRSLNLPSSQPIDGLKTSTNYRVVRRRLTAHEVDIKDLEAAVRGEGVESPREEIARLRRLQIEPDAYNMGLNKELSAPEKVLIPERYLDVEPSTPLSPEEEREKQKKVERIKTLIAKSNLQNVVPLLDGPAESRETDPEQQLQEQEKRIEISCALAAEASRRSRLLSAQCALSPSASPTSLAPLPSADFSDSSQIMKV